jgi:uncharacterized protein YcbX
VRIADLFIYPVKSCKGIAVDASPVGRMGLRYDRQWAFIDDAGTFLAQRSDSGRGIGVRTMCLIATAIEGADLALTAPDIEPLRVPLAGLDGADRPVRVWDSQTVGVDQGDAAAAWATTVLSRERPGTYRLVRMDDQGHRTAKVGTSELAYADAYPFLIVSRESLADLNARLTEPLPMNRFRPNIVLEGCAAYQEDRLDRLRAGGVTFIGMRLCRRCPIPTTNQETAERSVEPLRTLATYRRMPDGVVFGRNFNYEGEGLVRVGDAVEEVS